AAVTFSATLAAEYYGSNVGLGYIANMSLSMFAVGNLYAIVLSASLLSAALYGVGVGVDSFLALALRGTAAAPTPGVAPNTSSSGSPEPAWLRILQGAAAPVALVLLWELASRAGLIPAFFIPAPDAVVPRWLELVASGQLIADLAVTLARLVAA